MVRCPGPGTSEIDYAAEIPLFVFPGSGISLLSNCFPIPATQSTAHKGVNCLQCNVSYESLSPTCVMEAPPWPL